MRAIKIKLVIALYLLQIFMFSACIKEENLNLEYTGFVPGITGDGWTISDPRLENMDPGRLSLVYQDANQDKKYPSLRSLLIVRNGNLLAECYFKDRDDIRRLHNIMSATKSITSILAGIALDKGLIDSLDTPVYHYLAPYFDGDQRKQSITLRHVLTMETGLNFDNGLHTEELLSGKQNSLTYVIGKELIFTPGTDWYYGDGNPQLLSGIIDKVSGKSLSGFAEENLFLPLGIAKYRWEMHPDGLNFGGVGLWLLPRDMARIGLLMLNEGMWNGNPVVSKDWVKASTIVQSMFQDYGYYWYPVDGKAFYAEGHGGQLIWVYPEKNLVVVITSDPYTRSWEVSSNYNEIFRGIIESLEN